MSFIQHLFYIRETRPTYFRKRREKIAHIGEADGVGYSATLMSVVLK